MKCNTLKDHVTQFVGDHWKELVLIAASLQVGMMIGLNQASIKDSSVNFYMGERTSKIS